MPKQKQKGQNIKKYTKSKQDITTILDWKSKFITPSQACEEFDTCHSTLRNWSNAGYITCYKMGAHGKRRYDRSSIIKYFEDNKKPYDRRKKAMYIRISNIEEAEQKMKIMVELYKSKYPKAKIFSDIASSNDWNRPGFNDLFSNIMDGEIEKVIVTDERNLWRVGSNFFKRVLKKCDVKLTVDNNKEIINIC